MQVNLSQTQKILQDYGQRFEEENTRYVNLSRAMAQVSCAITYAGMMPTSGRERNQK